MKQYWIERFLEMAAMVASWSKDPNTRMGAVIVSDDRRHISVGYNGFPRGVSDDVRLTDRPLKRILVVHAEHNAVLNCPWDPHEIPSTIFITGQPCVDCAKAIIQSGIRRVIHVEYEFTDHWKESMEMAQYLLLEAGVEVIGAKRREEKS